MDGSSRTFLALAAERWEGNFDQFSLTLHSGGDAERFYPRSGGERGMRRNSNIEYRNLKQIRNPNSQMFETTKRRVNTARRKQKRIHVVFGYSDLDH